MELIEAIKRRRSERSYGNQKIERGTLEELVDAARLAPTARGEEPWEFVVIQSEKTLGRLADFAPNGAFLKGAAAAIAVFCRDTTYYLEDGCAATENILLAATSRDIGSCWIAGDKKPYADKVRELLGGPSGMKLVSLIALGYRSGAEGLKKERRSLADVIHWGCF
ncbi:MAG: nitroreductase family protein [Candidatus Omnitrophica bacterium]|nr:nitroreductase family protein [Candidatus Omnitrophota bacterium]